ETRSARWGIGTLVGIGAAYLVGLLVGTFYQVTQTPEPPNTWNTPWLAFFGITLGIVRHNLRLQHSLRYRLWSLLFVPVIVAPAYLLYPWSGFAAILTTLVIGLVLVAQILWIKPQGTSTADPAKYWAMQALAFVGVLLATQI